MACSLFTLEFLDGDQAVEPVVLRVARPGFRAGQVGVVAGDVGVALPTMVDDHHARTHAGVLDDLDVHEAAVVVDVYDFEPWLTNYENDLHEDAVLSGLELIAGLLHLADALATLHLVTALSVISHGQFLRTTADDSLTDLWLMCYDIASDADYSIGVCEVCHRLFIGASKNKRGHNECMNRQRVARSRAKRFKALIETGMTDNEASKIAGIAPNKARTILGPSTD